jgi:hypothetical protein
VKKHDLLYHTVISGLQFHEIDPQPDRPSRFIGAIPNHPLHSTGFASVR